MWMLINLFFVLASISELVIHSFIAKRRAKKEQAAAQAKESRTPSSEIYIITPDHNQADTHSTNGKSGNDLSSPNFMFNTSDLAKSHENLHSEVITVSSSTNNLLTLNGKLDTHSLHSTMHSSIENVLNYQNMNRMRRNEESLQTKIEEKKHPLDLDRICRWLFPALYLLFNFVYWVMLLNRWFDAEIFRTSDH